MSKQKNKKRSRDTETKPSGTTSPKFILTIGFSKLQTYIYIIQYCWEIIFYVFFWVKIYPFRARSQWEGETVGQGSQWVRGASGTG